MSSHASKYDDEIENKKENKYSEDDEKEREDYVTDPEESEEIEEVISIPYKPLNNLDTQSKSICDFVFKEEIGEGTFGHVKLSINKQTNEKVAIKIMEKKKIFQHEDKERVEREIKILKSIRHPNIIHLFSVLQTKENLYLIMEYARGKELYEFILINGKLDELTACCFFQQLISGLEYLHKNNIVHRDIKPENLIVNRRTKELKIVDFGLSNNFKNENNQLLSSSCGSPSYAAPEMLHGEKYKATPVDIWSSGIVLYAMVCGYLPFEDDNNDVLYKKICQGKFKIPKFISENCKDLIKKILVTDPEKRINIKEIKEHPWFNLYKNKGKIMCYEGLMINKYVIPIDENIVQIMSTKIGISEESIKISVLMNKHNDITTLYYLFLYKKINCFSNYKSVANLKGDLFIEYMNNPENLLSTYDNNYQTLINAKKKYFLSDNKKKTMGQAIGYNRNSQRTVSYNYYDKRPVSVGEFKTVTTLNKEILKNLDLNKIGNEKNNIIIHYQASVKRRNENKKAIEINLDNYNSYDYSEKKLFSLQTERNKDTKEKINTIHKNNRNKENNEALEKILSSLKKEIQSKGLEKVCESQQEIKKVSNSFFKSIPPKKKYVKKSSRESYIQHFKSNKKKIFESLENCEKNNNSIDVNNICLQTAYKNNKKSDSSSLSTEIKATGTKKIIKSNDSNKCINNINNINNIGNIDEDVKAKASAKIRFNRINISKKNIYENQLPNKNDNKGKNNEQLEQKTINYSTNIVDNNTISASQKSYNISKYNLSKNKNLKKNKINKKNIYITPAPFCKMSSSKNSNNISSSRKLSSSNIRKYANKKIVENNSNNDISSNNKHCHIHSELKNYKEKLIPESAYKITTKNNHKPKVHRNIITNLKNNISKSPPKNLLTASNKSKNRKLRNGIISELNIKYSKKNNEEEKNNKINSTHHCYNNRSRLLNSCHKNSSDINIIRKFHLSFNENEDLTSPINNTLNKISGLLYENENDFYHPFCLSDLHIKNKYILKTDIINNLQELKLRYKNTGFYFLVSDSKENLSFHIKIENINHTGFYVIKYKKIKGSNADYFRTLRKIKIQI